MTQGRVNTNHTLETQGISGLGEVYYNLMEPDIIAEALRRKEGWGKAARFWSHPVNSQAGPPMTNTSCARRPWKTPSGGTTTSRCRRKALAVFTPI